MNLEQIAELRKRVNDKHAEELEIIARFEELWKAKNGDPDNCSPEPLATQALHPPPIVEQLSNRPIDKPAVMLNPTKKTGPYFKTARRAVNHVLQLDKLPQTFTAKDMEQAVKGLHPSYRGLNPFDRSSYSSILKQLADEGRLVVEKGSGRSPSIYRKA